MRLSLILPALVEAVKGTDVQVGAQNMHFEDNGAFTGEISGVMLKDLVWTTSSLVIPSVEQFR